MARNSKKKDNSTAGGDGLVWINIAVPEEVYDHLDTTPPDSGQICDFILDSLGKGFSFSLKYSTSAKAYICTIVGPLDTGNTQIGVSCFAEQPDDALLGLYAKSVLVAHWDFGQFLENGSKPGRRFR